MWLAKLVEACPVTVDNASSHRSIRRILSWTQPYRYAAQVLARLYRHRPDPKKLVFLLDPVRIVPHYIGLVSLDPKFASARRLAIQKLVGSIRLQQRPL